MSKKYTPKKSSSFNSSKDGRAIRLCHAQNCPNSLWMPNRHPKVPIFGAPNGEFRRIWELAINGTTSGENIKLCYIHFREEDFVMNNEGLSLKKDAIPIPIAVPKTEITQDPLADMLVDPLDDPLTIMDVETIKSASDQQTVCKSCIDFNAQLQAARSEIAELKKKLSELTAKNTNVMKPLQCISNEEQCSKTCRLCKVKMTESQLQQHLCVDQESIECTLCPQSQAFKSTVSFVKHLDQHRDAIQSIDKRLWYKCNQCNLGYAINIMLECHKKSHEDIVELPIEEESNETDVVITIDETTSNDNSNLPDELATVKIEIDEPSGNEVPEAPEEINVAIQSSSLAEENLKPAEQTINLFNCGECNMAFDTAQILSRHLREIHKKRSRYVKCSVCTQKFTRHQQLRIHMQSHIKIIAKDQQCEICQMALTLDELNSHLCDDEPIIRCEYCSDEFTSIVKLLEHIEKSHEKKKLYRCEKCPKFFSMIQLKEFHMKTHANDKPKTFACKICPKTFANEYYLQLHINRHENAKSLLCEECGKSFMSEQSLELHKMSSIHHIEPTLQCPDCPKKFYNVSNLRKHREIHRDLIYVCEICKSELKSHTSYRKHMQKHKRKETDKRFECAACPLKFFSATRLKDHQRVHSSTKGFNCRFCDVSYKYNGDLHKHLKTHLGEKIYECPKCSERFQYQAELKKHDLVHYKEEKEANGLANGTNE